MKTYENSPSTYKLTQEDKEFKFRINIIRLFIIASAIVLMINTAIAWYEEGDYIVAVCPESGCIEKEPYYATYPEGSWERINAYCNQTKDLLESLNYKKCS